MTDRTKTGLEILQVSVLLGVLGNVLLRQTPWGLNAFLFVATFAAALVVLMFRRRPELLTKTSLALIGAMVFFGSMFLIRDSIELRVYDTFAILIIMGVLLLANLEVKAQIAGAFHYAAGFVWSGITSAFGPLFILGSDIEWKAMPGGKLSRHLFSVLRGLAIALPLVLIFGALFMAADAAFEGMVNRVVNFEIDVAVSHVVLTSVFAWLSAGYLRGSLITPFWKESTVATEPVPADSASEKADADLSFVEKVVVEPLDEQNGLPDNATILEHINRSDPPNTEAASAEPPKKKWNLQNLDSSKLPSVFTFGTVETVIVLGLIDLLFLSFVAMQLPYFFGGMDLVQNTPDFKLADYARRGFGELVAVAALVLPILLLSHWLLRKDGSRVAVIFKVLAGFQIALLFVIMASAVQRLILLTGELGYGLTTVRFYPMVFMTWLAVVFIWFAVTVLRNARQHFAWGALWSAIFILAATNLMNPDKFIVQTNIALMQQGRDFDASYNSRLSDDALPVIVDSFASLSTEDQQTVLTNLANRHCYKVAENDIRSWNYSRMKASEKLFPYDEILKNRNLYCDSEPE